jgi:peptide methionine sulfoxide reductase MsrB
MNNKSVSSIFHQRNAFDATAATPSFNSAVSGQALATASDIAFDLD